MSTVVSGMVRGSVSITKEYPASPPISVESFQINVPLVFDETVPPMCEVDVAITFVGAVVSTTVTTRVTCVATFPLPSVLLYVTTYDPMTAVLTPEALITNGNPMS